MAGKSRILSLLWADVLIGYAFFVLQNYLTGVWGLSFTHAAAIVNLWCGACFILPFFFLFLVDAFLGNFFMLLLSSLAYSVGIAFVAMSTPPVLANYTGTCKDYKPACIGDTQKLLFYIGLPLVAVGLAGHEVSLRPFDKEQDSRLETKSLSQLLALCLVVIIPIIGAIALPHIKPWSIHFGIPAVFATFTTLLFLTGSCSYEMKRPEGTISPKEGKVVACIIPLSITLVICGMVSSTGSTYFVEQANHMNRKLGSWNVPAPLLLLLYRWAKKFFGMLVRCLLPKSEADAPSKPEPYAALLGIALAMILSILCCVTAARIETQRLNVIRRHGSSDKASMSVFWLLFQYFLLAGLDSFVKRSVAAFFISRCPANSPASMVNYLRYFSRAVFGLGFMSSVLTVYLVGRIKPSWFQFTLNTSRLDKYYWVLAALSSIELVVFICVAIFYRHRNLVADGEAAFDIEAIDDGDGCACC